MTTQRASDLQPHPRNAEIYGDSADNGLVDSIKSKGVLTPLLITWDNRIISGHRRWDAAKQIGLAEVPIAVFQSRDELDIEEALIESNRYRAKTNEQIGRESDALWDIAERRARDRREHREPESELEAESEGDSEGVTEPVPEAPTEPEDGSGETRDEVGKKVGVSGRTAERARRVVKVIDRLEEDGRTFEAEHLRSLLNKNAGKALKYAKERGWIETRARKEPAPKPKTEWKGYITLAEWQKLDKAEQQAIVGMTRSKSTKFNKQDSDSIEWAQWSWNPVTGCKHDCSYCYARDFAEKYYSHLPTGGRFVPAFMPERLSAPFNTTVPHEAEINIAYKNVFTCSMADLFGRWVPREWIEAVLEEVREQSQWNFLFLTKFPTRLAEFDFPDNAWVGTTVDAQARVANAEKAFRGVRAAVKWLSCEPLLEPLRFNDLSIFDWVVVGGSSWSSQTPEFRPPREWVEQLEIQARQAGCRIYEKTNLLDRIRDYPGQPERKLVDVPAAFKMGYLQRDIHKPTEYQAEMVGTAP